MGSTKQKQTSESHSEQAPWQPTIEPLKGIIGQINAQIPNAGVTGTENAALDTLSQNAQSGNPYAPQIGNIATELLGGGPDRTGMASSGYDALNTRLSPYADGAHMGPNGNPMLANYLNTIGNDIQTRVNGMFAAGGRDYSGANQQSLARGIAEGTAPILAAQYNTDVGRQFDAANQLYSGSNTTTGLLSGLDQTRLGNQQAGIGVANDALNARDSSAQRVLDVAAQRRNLPLQNSGNLAGLLTPLAQLGGSASSVTNSSGVTTPPIGMQIAQGAGAIKGGGGGRGWGGGSAGGAGMVV